MPLGRLAAAAKPSGAGPWPHKEHSRTRAPHPDRLRRADVAAPDILLVKPGQASEIIFAPSDIEQQLRRCRAIFDLAQRLGKAVATLDLAVTNSVPVCWQDPSVIPPGPPKLPKPLRVKKK